MIWINKFKYVNENYKKHRSLGKNKNIAYFMRPIKMKIFGKIVVDREYSL